MARDFVSPAGRRAWARRLLAPLDDAPFGVLARELFAWQFARVPAYRRLCLAHGVTPKNLSDWRQIPALPQQVFKLEPIFAHYPVRPRLIFETSGTTTGTPGQQLLLDEVPYRAAAVEGARRAGFLRAGTELHFLAPSPRAAPRSSLSAMFGHWHRAEGQGVGRFWASREGFDFAGLRAALQEAIRGRRQVTLSGTAFAFVHLLDAWAGAAPLRLPRGSFLLETGGFKGRSREVEKNELYAALARIFGVPADAIWNEYGMSELSSQAYTRGVRGLHVPPPWARVLVWDPATNHEVRPGGRGLVRWIDLANIDSVLALQTLDVAERTPAGFRLIGRLPRTEPRGCSLGAEDIAARAAPRLEPARS